MNESGSLRLVVCLCAAWCGTCRDYRALFDGVVAPRGDAASRWVDIEDESDLVGDLNIETFPTLLVIDAPSQPAGAPQVRFFGPLTPHAATLSRLLDSMDDARPAISADVQELSARLWAQR